MAPVRYRALPEPHTLLPPQTSSRLAPPPTCVALSGDGTRAAVGVGSSLYVLDLTKESKSAAQAKELFRKDLPDTLHCVAFSEDDSVIAAGDAFGRCHVFHGHHGNSVHVFPHVRPERLLNKSDDDLALMELAVNGLAFSSDTLATCGADGGVSLWRLACGTRQRELYDELIDDPDDDERSEADKARDRRVLGWLSPEMRTMLKPAPAPAGYICACFCGDASLVVGGERDELHVWVNSGEWAATPPEPSKQLKGHDQWVVSLSYGNETLASLDVAGLLILWKDFVPTKQLCVGATGASVHLSEKWLITGGDAMVKVFDLQSLTCRQSFKAHELQVLKVDAAFDEEGEGFTVATVGGDRRTLLWRVDQEALCGECVLVGLSGHAWRDDPEAEIDDACVVGGKLVTTDRAKLRLRVFDGDGRAGKTCTNEKTGSTRPPSRFEVISANNDMLVTVCEEGRCSTWSVEDDFSLTRSWSYHGDLRPRSVCATWPNGPVCTCDVAGKLMVVDPSTGGLLNDFDGFESNDGDNTGFARYWRNLGGFGLRTSKADLIRLTERLAYVCQILTPEQGSKPGCDFGTLYALTQIFQAFASKNGDEALVGNDWHRRLSQGQGRDVDDALAAVQPGDRVDLAVMLHLGLIILFRNIDTSNMAALFKFFTETYDATVAERKTDNAYKVRGRRGCTALDGFDIAFKTKKHGVVGHDPFGNDERDAEIIAALSRNLERLCKNIPWDVSMISGRPWGDDESKKLREKLLKKLMPVADLAFKLYHTEFAWRIAAAGDDVDKLLRAVRAGWRDMDAGMTRDRANYLREVDAAFFKLAPGLLEPLKSKRVIDAVIHDFSDPNWREGVKAHFLRDRVGYEFGKVVPTPAPAPASRGALKPANSPQRLPKKPRT